LFPGKLKLELQHAELESGAPVFSSLDAFRPLGERAPDPQIAEAQRREFFNQLIAGYGTVTPFTSFANNDGERQRFTEIWAELVGQASRPSSSEKDLGKKSETGATPVLRFTLARSHAGSCAKKQTCHSHRLGIFGRYKIQRPRRLKSRKRWPPFRPRH